MDDFIFLVYLELQKCDIMSVIKTRQFKFFQKLKSLNRHDAICRKILDLCNDMNIIQYYESLTNSCQINLDEKYRLMMSSDSTHMLRYKRLCYEPDYSILYKSNIPEYIRKTITRWRLSSHNLRIETGRHNGTVCNARRCLRCFDSLEDEEHVFFYCPRYSDIRVKFSAFLNNYHSIETILRPKSYNDAIILGKLIIEIENPRE